MDNSERTNVTENNEIKVVEKEKKKINKMTILKIGALLLGGGLMFIGSYNLGKNSAKELVPETDDIPEIPETETPEL